MLLIADPGAGGATPPFPPVKICDQRDGCKNEIFCETMNNL